MAHFTESHQNKSKPSQIRVVYIFCRGTEEVFLNAFLSFYKKCNLIEFSVTVNIGEEEIITTLYVFYDFSEMK